MAQFGRPFTDTTRDNWEEDDGGTTDIFDQIDEVTADNADFIRTQLTPTSDVYVTKLTSVEDPISSTGHILRYNYGKDVTGGDQINLTVSLNQAYVNEGGQGVVKWPITTPTDGTHTNIASGWTSAVHTLSGAEADSITNYADLFLRFVANKP
jgi:hypothetical protein